MAGRSAVVRTGTAARAWKTRAARARGVERRPEARSAKADCEPRRRRRTEPSEHDAAMGWERGTTAGLLLALTLLGCVMGGPPCIGLCWLDGPAAWTPSASLIFSTPGRCRSLLRSELEPWTCAAAGDGGPSYGAHWRGGSAAAQPRHIGGSAYGLTLY
jgi:hypothetical protein